MTEQITTTKNNNIFFNLLVGALAYTAFGTASALLWSFAASTVSVLPAIGLLPFLALWWCWLLWFFPNMALFISIFQVMKNTSNT